MLIGEILLQSGKVSAQDIEKGLALQQKIGGKIGAILVRTGALSEDTLLPALAEQLGYGLLSTSSLPATADIETIIDGSGLGLDWLVDQKTVVWEQVNGEVHCACRDPLDSNLQETVEAAFPGRTIVWLFARSQDIDGLLATLKHGQPTVFRDDAAHLREMAEEAPVIELVSNIFAQAFDERASDIHLEPGEREFLVRYRIDGILHRRLALPRERFDAVASRIKLISAMDIAERRLPQDGRISMRAAGMEMDIRVSSVPGVHGESIVMRLLPKERVDIRLDTLGFERDHLQLLKRWLGHPNGILLVTGPTGSGKSTTLYAALDASNDGSRKIITVEDPVEYRLKGITQIQTHSEIGYTFARALRAILRQDPDVIMIGEIRDLETAEIAVQSSLTGHMVFSTLHTNDAISAFTRLVDMGLEPFLMAASVRAVIAQRLIRRLCARCAEPSAAPEVMTELLLQEIDKLTAGGELSARWRRAVGCRECNGTGYRGRVGIYEFIDVSTSLADAIMHQATSGELLEIARRQGFRSLREDGMLKAWRGETSVDEVLRVTATADNLD